MHCKDSSSTSCKKKNKCGYTVLTIRHKYQINHTMATNNLGQMTQEKYSQAKPNKCHQDAVDYNQILRENIHAEY